MVKNPGCYKAYHTDNCLKFNRALQSLPCWLTQWRCKSVWSGRYSLILLFMLLFPVIARAPSVIALVILFHNNPVMLTQFSTALNKSWPVVVSLSGLTLSNSSLSSKWEFLPRINTTNCVVPLHWYFNPLREYHKKYLLVSQSWYIKLSIFYFSKGLTKDPLLKK